MPDPWSEGSGFCFNRHLARRPGRACSPKAGELHEASKRAVCRTEELCKTSDAVSKPLPVRERRASAFSLAGEGPTGNCSNRPFPQARDAARGIAHAACAVPRAAYKDPHLDPLPDRERDFAKLSAAASVTGVECMVRRSMRRALIQPGSGLHLEDQSVGSAVGESFDQSEAGHRRKESRRERGGAVIGQRNPRRQRISADEDRVVADRAPARLDAGAVVEDGVIQVEENRLGRPQTPSSLGDG